MKHKQYYDPKSLGLEVAGYSSDNEVTVHCPFHNDSHASASFNIETGLFFCFGQCGGKNIQQLSNELGQNVNVILIKPVYNKDVEKTWLRLLDNPLALNNPYLAARRVTNDSVKEFDIRANKHGVIFPIKDTKGKVKGVQIRSTTKEYRYRNDLPKYMTFGNKLPLWPLQKQYTHDKVFVCEGVFGAINLIQMGYNAYATLGALLKQDVKKYLNNFEQVKGLFDSDFAGKLASGRLIKFVPHAYASVNGLEVDEILDIDIPINTSYTNDLYFIAHSSGDSKKFWQRMPKGS